MSHIHLPDGVLPVWLWVSGYIAVILIWTILLRSMKNGSLTKRLPLLGMMAAVMVLGASVEIIPIAYHVNLTVISGILLGPSLIFLATFVVNVILALFGHGGITVIGLNTLVLSIEGIAGYFLFRLFWRVLRKLTLATFFATFLALAISTFAMIGVVSLGTPHYEELIHQPKAGIIGFEFGKEKETHQKEPIPEKEVNLKRFISIILPLGFVGWVLEGIITVLIARYIQRLRPDLLRLKPDQD
ncbi:MAG TPA: energy-coupling factor ABC transporter permease [Thermodesulfobacteriota bacterium]|nr:energy-coupling factor ABC transporter permease [Thermodesulfobacteriota bacterium]